jgi:signal transduction histidine kinase
MRFWSWSDARWPALWVGLVLSSVVGLLFYLGTVASIESDARVRFNNLVRNAHYAIATRIAGYTDLLRNSASMLQTHPDTTRADFHQYVSGLALARHFPGIETINFARYLTHAQRPAFEAGLRAEEARGADGYPAFGIRPAGVADEYTVLVYVEPCTVWAARVAGLDLEARPAVRKALEEARDTGRIAASGLPLPLLRGPNKVALGMRMPIYRRHLPTSTVAERRAAYLGSVGIGFSVQKMVQRVLDDLPQSGLRVGLVDQGSGAHLFDSAATMAQPDPAPDRADSEHFADDVALDFNGRNWLAHFSIGRDQLYTAFDRRYPMAASAAGFLVTLLLYALFHTLASSRLRAIHYAADMTRELRESQAELQLSHDHLQRLAAHADQIKEEERKRIAREIHDDLGQNLLALRIEADLLATRTAGRQPRLHLRARATLQQIDATIRSVRQIINDLRPNVLDLGLSAAVDWQITEFRRRSALQCELLDSTGEIIVDDHVATAFFRILQESLNNITRHAQATYVRVDLRLQDGELRMTVADNGRGMHPSMRDKPASFGLVGIEERIKILGGKFTVRSGPGLGTTLTVSVPIAGGAAISKCLDQAQEYARVA